MKGVVLTGGRSTRMGRDKALIEVDGTALAVRVADTLRRAGCDHVWAQGGDRTALTRAGLDVVPDERPGEGPVPAIATALATAAPDSIVVAACDLLDLDVDAVATLLAASRAGTDWVVAASDAHGPHLLSVWRIEALAPVLAAVEQGVRSYRQLLEAVEATTVELPSRVLRNANRPDDLPGRG